MKQNWKWAQQGLATACYLSQEDLVFSAWFWGFFGCSLQVCFSLTFTSLKSAPVSESPSCSRAPRKCQSDFELNNQILLISSDLPETKDASRLKASNFMCSAWFFSFVAIWNNCWNRVAGNVVHPYEANKNFKWFFSLFLKEWSIHFNTWSRSFPVALYYLHPIHQSQLKTSMRYQETQKKFQSEK